MICGALRWLEDREQGDREAMERTLAGTGSLNTAATQDDSGEYNYNLFF